MKKVYVAGALSADACGYIQNLHRMCMWAIAVKQRGFSIFVPGLDFMMGFLSGSWGYHEYFDNNQPFLECCDAIFLVPGWESSKGTKKEIELAKEKGIPICMTLEELEAV